MLKSINIIKNLQQLTGKTDIQHQNGSIIFTHNNINPKCKWAKYTNQKTWTGKLDKKPKPISVCVLYPGNPSHMQRYTEIQNTGMESKKKQELQSLSEKKIDFKPTKIKRGKEGNYIMV